MMHLASECDTMSNVRHTSDTLQTMPHFNVHALSPYQVTKTHPQALFKISPQWILSVSPTKYQPR